MKFFTPQLSLFSWTFLSVFLICAGIFTLLALFWPLIVSPLRGAEAYQPQLPLAENRKEALYDLSYERQLAKRLYPAVPAPEGLAAGNWIRIPAIGVEVPLVLSKSLADADVLATLDKGAALYPNGVAPGRLGNTFISAHSTGEPWKGKYRFAFLRINELQPGNEIHLDWQGTRYTYRIAKQEIVRPTPDFKVISDRPVPTLALMACWPLWSTDKRMLIHAELTNVTQLTKAPTS